MFYAKKTETEINKNDVREVCIDLTLNQFTEEQRGIWAQNVINQLRNKCDTKHDDFIILAGKNYYTYLLPVLEHYSLPLHNLQMGFRMATLMQLIQHLKTEPVAFPSNTEAKDSTLNKCDKLHYLFNRLHHYSSSEISLHCF